MLTQIYYICSFLKHKFNSDLLFYKFTELLPGLELLLFVSLQLALQYASNQISLKLYDLFTKKKKLNKFQVNLPKLCIFTLFQLHVNLDVF